MIQLSDVSLYRTFVNSKTKIKKQNCEINLNEAVIDAQKRGIKKGRNDGKRSERKSPLQLSGQRTKSMTD